MEEQDLNMVCQLSRSTPRAIPSLLLFVKPKRPLCLQYLSESPQPGVMHSLQRKDTRPP